MRLIDFLRESVATTDSAIAQMIQNLNSLAVLHSGQLLDLVRDQYARGEHEDMGKVVKRLVRMRKGKWFGDNYLSTSRHRETPTTGLQRAFLTIARDPKFQPVAGKLNKLGSFTIQSSNKVRQESPEFSTSGYIDEIIATIPGVLARMAEFDSLNRDRLQACANRLQQAVNKFTTDANRIHDEWDREWGKTADVRREQEKRQQQQQSHRQAYSAQADQASQIVDQVLAGVDKRNAHEIRQLIARSDNKLQTLQQEMTRRGLM